jgi:thioredoxin 1
VSGDTGKRNRMKILRFTASWCNPCKTLASNLEKINTHIPIEVVDIDIHTEVALEYGVRSVPTLVMLGDTGAELKRIVGVKTIPDLEKWIAN